jgi:hypothetical protein
VTLIVDAAPLVALGDSRDRLHAAVGDLSVVILAHRFRTRRLLTFDERDFRAVTPIAGGSFTLLPRDTQG